VEQKREREKDNLQVQVQIRMLQERDLPLSSPKPTTVRPETFNHRNSIQLARWQPQNIMDGDMRRKRIRFENRITKEVTKQSGQTHVLNAF